MFESVAKSWLDLQCKLIPGASQGLLALGTPDQGPFEAAACWPEGIQTAPQLAEVAKQALNRRQVVSGEVQAIPGQNQPKASFVGCPLVVDGKLFGVVALELASQANLPSSLAFRMLQLGASWLEVLIRQTKSAGEERLAIVLDLIATTLEPEQFQEAVMGVANEMATRLACERVSIGFLKGKNIRVLALSHSADFDPKQNLVKAIAGAMGEALDQECTLTYPALDNIETRLLHAHAELAGAHGAVSVCSIPFACSNHLLGAVTLERMGERLLDGSTVALLEHAVSVLGPILELRRNEDRWLLGKTWDAGRTQMQRLLGRGRLGRKFAALATVIVAAALGFATGEYRITADAVLEGAVQRVVAAPQEGYIATAEVRPGDLVRSGQLLGSLDDKDLRLEHRKWSSQREQLLKEYREALAKHDRAKVSVVRARLNQSEAQIELLNEQLARIQITAPFDGIVVSGDLTRSLGSPVERGQELHKIAPLDDYRIILKVDEREISDVEQGQSGDLALTAFPGEQLSFFVDKVTPVSIAADGRNYFEVEGRLENPTVLLRPGMQGVGKIGVDRRKLVWIWTHELIDWLRLWVWSWWP